METLLTWFMRIWIGLVVLANLAAIAGFFLTAPTFWQGWSRVSDIYSPFNFLNYLMEVIALSPAIGAYALRERLRRRALARAGDFS